MPRLLSEVIEAPPVTSNWPWLKTFRQQAHKDFSAQGLPHGKLEEWKYTSIKALTEAPFKDALPPTADELAETHNRLTKTAVSDSSTGQPDCRLTFIAGHFQAGLSLLELLPSGVKLMPISQALEQEHALISAHLGRIAQHSGHPFAALNSLRQEEGMLLYIPADCQLEQTIHCLFFSPERQVPQACYPRLLIVLEQGARAQVVEEYLASPSQPSSSQPSPSKKTSEQEQENGAPQFTDTLTEVVLAPGAQLTHCKLLRENAQGYHIAGIHVEQAENSRFHSFSLALGGALCRNDIQVRLVAEGAETQLDGLYILSDRQHLDNHLRIDHLQPACRSEVFYKGILNNRAHGVFNGMAIVHPGAQLSDARQVNKNLMLSTGAEMDTKPELQIEADDVKCSHGATVGQLDNEALFYLASRGLDQNTARNLLTFAFAQEVLNRIPSAPLREQLSKLTGDVLASQLDSSLQNNAPQNAAAPQENAPQTDTKQPLKR